MLYFWIVDPIRRSAWATCFYVLVFVLSVIYIHHQFRESIKVRKLQVDIALNAERNRVDNIDLHQELHECFFDNDCSYRADRASKELKTHVSEIVRSCNRIGLLLDYLDRDSPAIYARAHYF